MASSNLVIDSILKAEQKADQIIANAKNNAIKILSDAEANSEQIKQKALEDCKINIANNLKASEESFSLAHKERLNEYKNDASKLIEKSNKNMQKAVEILVKRVK